MHSKDNPNMETLWWKKQEHCDGITSFEWRVSRPE